MKSRTPAFLSPNVLMTKANYFNQYLLFLHLRNKMYLDEEEKLTVELNFLKALINPHFLFNILNMAFSSASTTGDEQTANIIGKLSGSLNIHV